MKRRSMTRAVAVFATAGVMALSLFAQGGEPATLAAPATPKLSVPSAKAAVTNQPEAALTEDGWAKVFADEPWYRVQEGAEREFTGVLKAVGRERTKNGKVATTLMRDALYQLGDRTLYTGGKKAAALEAMVGKTVAIRGKAVDMALEGVSLREIWPAEIRETKDAAAK